MKNREILRKLKSKKVNLSVVIITKNEQEVISGCLESIKWADEILVIDSGSEDKTKEIAMKNKAIVREHVGGNYSVWRNIGLKYAHGKWILYIDADERVTTELRNEISDLIYNLQTPRKSAYAIPRRNIILGKEMKHGGWWPDYVKRLYLRNSLKGWTGELHEEPHFLGNLGHLNNPLIHLKHDDLSEMVIKTNIWSDVEAKLMYKSGHPPMNIIRFSTAILRELWLRMFKYKAFLDGSEGIIYALYQVYSRFISYAKLWEMQLNYGINNNIRLNNEYE